jgi:hypothetical protein
VLAASKPLPPDIVDSETGIPLPQPGFPSAAVAPDGTVYVAVEDNTSASSGDRRGQVAGRRSHLDQRHPAGVTAFAFEPAVAVDAHGTVGVTWYDLRNDRPGDAALSAAGVRPLPGSRPDGGAFVQLLLDAGYSSAGVSIAGAAVKGVRALPFSEIRATFPLPFPQVQGASKSSLSEGRSLPKYSIDLGTNLPF